MQIKYEVGYMPTLDKTIIFKFEKRENDITETICGWYYGTPYEETTEFIIDRECGMTMHHDKEVFNEDTWEAIGK